MKARRKLLNSMSGIGVGALSSAVASAWVKPVVNMVVLPAHAQASNQEAPIVQVDPLLPNESCLIPPPISSDVTKGAIVSLRNDGENSLTITNIIVSEGEITLPDDIPITISSGERLNVFARSLIITCDDSSIYAPVFTFTVMGYNEFSLVEV